MLIKSSTIYIYLFTVFIFGTSIFLYGFYPLSFSHDKPASFSDIPVQFKKNLYKPLYSRTILMIIDALRFDFIYNKDAMKYTQALLDNENACIFNIRVHPPTVTLPRIKAMTSGTIPSFIDVVFNFGNPEMKIDTFIEQLRTNNNGKIVFYGDNTWTQMFPNIFYRSGENRDAFFVNDFYEGDKNITRALEFELRNRDWNLLILHYLGLDHIGHVEGPFSNKVPIKLKEMDSVIAQINEAMKKWDKKSLFVITGDHGMRDSGGHGGSSYPETHVPLIVIGPNCTQSERTYEQTDFATTISVLLGLPIPSSSIGSVISELIIQLSLEEQLFALHYSTNRILEKVKKINGDKKNFNKKEFYIQYEDAILYHEKFLQNNKQMFNFKKAKLLYTSASKQLTDILTHNFLKYDLFSIFTGIILNIWTFLTLIFYIFGNSIDKKIIINMNIKKFIFCILFIFGIKHFLCKISNINSNLCEFNWTSNIINVIIGMILFGNLSIWNSNWDQFTRNKISSLKGFTYCEYFLFISFIFHTISYISSSFIEEEHQLWYYITNTLFLIIFFNELKLKNIFEEIYEMKIFKLIWLKLNGSIDDFNKIDNNYYDKRYIPIKVQRNQTIIISAITINNLRNCILSWIFLFLIHIFLRRLNQTGDKWLHLSDIGDWLIADENKISLSLFLVLGLGAMIFGCCEFGTVLTNILTFTAAVLIYYYRTITESVLLVGIKTSNSKTSLAIFWLNILEIICINYIPLIYKRYYLKQKTLKDIKTVLGGNVVLFCIISSLLHKPHNVILNGALIMSCNMINHSCNQLYFGIKKNYIKIFAHIWIGKLFYFYQGNSNSLASIDLNAGFIGLDKYNIILVGIFLTINTYSGILLSFLILLYNIFEADDENKINANNENQINIPMIILLVTISILTPFTIYLVIMLSFRNHIFVWTVFSPKIIYEFYHMCLMYFILFITKLIY